MALTRKMLKAMGISDEIIDQIIEAHTETVDGLKGYKADAEKLAEVQAQLEAKTQELEAAKKDGWKDKHDALRTEFDAYKAAVEAGKAHAAKETAYREILRAAGVGEKHIGTLLRVSGDTIDKIELLEDGKAKDADKLTEAAKTAWSDFIPVTGTKGAEVTTPPANTSPAPDTSKMSDAEYFRYMREKKG